MPKFVIGIGSQRAGTTLLHRILDQCTTIFMHPLKELHYFDTMYSVRQEAVLRKYSQQQLAKENQTSLKPLIFQCISKRYRCFFRTLNLLSIHSVSSLNYPNLYYPYTDAKRLLGEITPEYMILPETGIQNMAEVIGSDAKIILIARNPTKRFISSVKLLKANNRETVPREIFEQALLKTMETMPGWMIVQDRLNDYESALSSYHKHFDNVLFLSYDNITQDIDETHSVLEGFLDQRVNKKRYQSLLGMRVNAIAETAPVSDQVVQSLNDRYKESIRFLEEYFGAGNCIL